MSTGVSMIDLLGVAVFSGAGVKVIGGEIGDGFSISIVVVIVGTNGVDVVVFDGEDVTIKSFELEDDIDSIIAPARNVIHKASIINVVLKTVTLFLRGNDEDT